MTASFRCWAEIDIEAVRYNIRVIRSMIADGVLIVAVVKADAYGHGLSEIASRIDRDVDMFGVANLSEGRTIRSTGARSPILILARRCPKNGPRSWKRRSSPQCQPSKKRLGTRRACVPANGCPSISSLIRVWGGLDCGRRKQSTCCVQSSGCLNCG